jgi:hypothetical protein
MFRRSMIVAVAVLAMPACADRTTPTDPGGETSVPLVSPAQVPMRRLARSLARALADSGFRARLRAELSESPFPEQKIFFQGLLTARNREALRDIARISGAREGEIQDDAIEAAGLELYLPVPEHRARWNGDEQILVATAIADNDVPVAYDTRGREHRLDPLRPPAIPVLSLVPVETDFSRRPAPATCTIDTCPPTGGGGGGGGGGGTGGGGSSPPAPGLYMTYAHTTQTFESGLKGNPEFEIHVLGQLGSTDSLKDYQCAGEHAGGPYVYDQNGLDWSGGVLLFSQAQLDAYRAQHPGQSFRIFMVEDDDASCEIRNGSSTLESILAVVDAAYNVYTGGRDSTAGGLKYFRKARALQKLLQRLGQLINTNDELVGNAVEDVVVGQFYSGANWIIKGENNVTNGWIKLVMH